MSALELLLKKQGVELVDGDYLIHGSGLLDALDMRAAGDIDLIVRPEVYDTIADKPGWYVRMAGTNKDHPVLQHPDLDRIGVEISKAYDEDEIGGPQVTIRDLAENTVTIKGKQFISPDQLTRMKRIALDDGAKVSKNKRDLAFLDGRLTWAEDVARFGQRLNSSGRAAAASLLERRAIQLYGKGSFDLNPKLREGLRLTDSEAKQVAHIDRAIARQKTPHRVKVYRGLRMSREEAMEMFGDKINTVVTEKSYLSTGLREQVARKYGQSGVYLEIDVPQGTPGYFAPYRALAPEPTPNSILRMFGEDELLLPRNTRYRIKEIVDRPDGTVLVRAELVPSRLGTPPAPNAGRLFSQIEGDIPGPPRINPVKGAATQSRMGLDIIPDALIPKILERQLQVPGFEDLKPLLRRKSVTPRQILDQVVARQADFLLELAERSWRLSPDAARLHARWYPDAHDWIDGLADANSMIDGVRTSITREGSYAATAALSPSALWPNNVAWAKRMIEAIARQDSIVVKREWIEARYLLETAGGKHVRRRSDLVGRTLGDLDDEDAAFVMRAWHDADPVKQLGGRAGFGNPVNTAMPQSADNLVKAVKVLRDGTPQNIDRVLGGQKVRSFNSNLARPFDVEFEDVTVDTHHFGAANGIPWTTSSRFVSTKAGSINLTERPSAAGVAGTYPPVTEATRIAAKAFNDRYGTDFFPDQFQSIVWEMWRALHPSDFRSAKLEARIDAIRSARALGRITPGEERRLVEAARVVAGAPTEREILEAFSYDLRGEDRRTWAELKERMRRR